MIGLAQAVANNSLRLDSWKSALGSLGSLGGRADRGRSDRMRLVPNLTLDDYTLSSAYKDMWLVRKIVDARCDEALRGGWGVDEQERLENFTRLNVATHTEGAFQRACHMADLKGGSMLFIGYRHDGGPGTLLEPAPVGSEVTFLEVFDKFQLQGSQRVTDIDSPEYGRPQIWQVTGTRRAGLRFHASRGIRFPGAAKGSDLGTTEQDRDWGHSQLQAVWDDVVRYGVFWQSITHLMQISSVGVLKLHGLIELLASKNRADADARVDLLNEMMSLTRLFMLDAKQGEEYHREAVSFADVPALLQELQVATAAAVGRPVTKLFGRSPAGMNATGESDTRMWYDDVASYRQIMIEPRLESLLAITERRAIDVEFEPLWQPTAKEKAEVRQMRTNTNERNWSMGVWSDAELRQAENAGKLPEEMGFSDTPTAEPTRAVTTIAVVPPGENPSALRDPKAPDEPAPAKAPAPFPPKA